MVTSANYESNQEMDLTRLDRSNACHKNTAMIAAIKPRWFKMLALLCAAAAGCAVLERGPENSSLLLADALNAEYGEQAGGGIRGGKQQPLFEAGNECLQIHFPRLDFIKRAIIEP
jgi:hypothetical protein